MGVSSLYYTLMFAQMQYRYGEIKAISFWNLKISLRSEGSDESEESSIYRKINAPRFRLSPVYKFGKINL